MNLVQNFFLHGVSLPDVTSLLLRIALGMFFILARFRWFYDPSKPRTLTDVNVGGKNEYSVVTNERWFNPLRHSHLVWKLCTCGYGSHPLLVAFVAFVEVFGGAAVVVGLLTNLALLGLLGVLTGATFCTAKTKVCEQNPVDCIDCVSCYLWRVEGVYITIALSLLALGPGKLSIDWLVF